MKHLNTLVSEKKFSSIKFLISQFKATTNNINVPSISHNNNLFTLSKFYYTFGFSKKDVLNYKNLLSKLLEFVDLGGNKGNINSNFYKFYLYPNKTKVFGVDFYTWKYYIERYLKLLLLKEEDYILKFFVEFITNKRIKRNKTSCILKLFLWNVFQNHYHENESKSKNKNVNREFYNKHIINPNIIKLDIERCIKMVDGNDIYMVIILESLFWLFPTNMYFLHRIKRFCMENQNEDTNACLLDLLLKFFRYKYKQHIEQVLQVYNSIKLILLKHPDLIKLFNDYASSNYFPLKFIKSIRDSYITRVDVNSFHNQDFVNLFLLSINPKVSDQNNNNNKFISADLKVIAKCVFNRDWNDEEQNSSQKYVSLMMDLLWSSSKMEKIIVEETDYVKGICCYFKNIIKCFREKKRSEELTTLDQQKSQLFKKLFTFLVIFTCKSPGDLGGKEKVIKQFVEGFSNFFDLNDFCNLLLIIIFCAKNNKNLLKLVLGFCRTKFWGKMNFINKIFEIHSLINFIYGTEFYYKITTSNEQKMWFDQSIQNSIRNQYKIRNRYKREVLNRSIYNIYIFKTKERINYQQFTQKNFLRMYCNENDECSDDLGQWIEYYYKIFLV